MKYLVVNTELQKPNTKFTYLGIVVSSHRSLERALKTQAKLYRQALYPPFRFSIYTLPFGYTGHYLPEHFVDQHGPCNHPVLVREGARVVEVPPHQRCRLEDM